MIRGPPAGPDLGQGRRPRGGLPCILISGRT